MGPSVANGSGSQTIFKDAILAVPNPPVLLSARAKDSVDLALEAEDRLFRKKHRKERHTHVHSRTPVGVDLDFGVLHLALAIARGHLDASENLLNQGSASHIQRTAELLRVKGLKAAGAGGLIYDLDGRLVEERLSNKTSVHFRYDDHGRLLLATFPDGDALHFHYDFMGGIEKVDPHSKGNRRAIFTELVEKFRSTINHLTHQTGMDNGVSPLRRSKNNGDDLGMMESAAKPMSVTDIEKKTTSDDLTIPIQLSKELREISETYSEETLSSCFQKADQGLQFIRTVKGIQNKLKDEAKQRLAQLRSRLKSLESSENPNLPADDHDRVHSEVVSIQEESIRMTQTVEQLFYLDPETSCETCVNCILEQKQIIHTRLCPRNTLCQSCYTNLPQSMKLDKPKKGDCPICLQLPCPQTEQVRSAN